MKIYGMYIRTEVHLDSTYALCITKTNEVTDWIVMWGCQWNINEIYARKINICHVLDSIKIADR